MRYISVAPFISQSCKKMHQKSNKDLGEPWQSLGASTGKLGLQFWGNSHLFPT